MSAEEEGVAAEMQEADVPVENADHYDPQDSMDAGAQAAGDHAQGEEDANAQASAVDEQGGAEQQPEQTEDAGKPEVDAANQSETDLQQSAHADVEGDSMAAEAENQAPGEQEASVQPDDSMAPEATNMQALNTQDNISGIRA
jgi:hypothetical protein